MEKIFYILKANIKQQLILKIMTHCITFQKYSKKTNLSISIITNTIQNKDSKHLILKRVSGYHFNIIVNSFMDYLNELTDFC